MRATAEPERVRRYARALLRSEPRSVATAAVLNVAAALAALGLPNVLGGMAALIATEVHVGAGPDLLRELNLSALGGGIFLLAQTLLSWWAARSVLLLAERLLNRLREDFLDGLLTLPLTAVEKLDTGDLLSRVTADADQVGLTFRYALPTFFVNATTVLVLLVGSLAVSPLLTVTVLIVFPILVPAVRWYFARYPQAFGALMAQQAAMHAVVAESADGARTIDTLRWRHRRARRLEEEITRTRAAFHRTIRLRGALFPTLDLCSLLPTLTTLILGLILIRTGQADLGTVTTVALLMQTLALHMINIVDSLDQLQTGGACLARLVGVMPTGEPGKETRRVPAGALLEASAVRYTYDDAAAREVLHGIDLDLRPGEHLALVGPTGAGKTTLARLMAGVDVATEGSVKLGHIPLADLGLPSLRRQVMLTTQESHVFVGTLAENLRIAAPDATYAELEEALFAVGAADWAAQLPEKLDTRLNGAHGPFPPDKAQQLALARILLAGPRVLVLDEATSMLSPSAVRGTEEALTRFLAGRTVVSIVHHLHTARRADRIAVLEDGRLVEIGTHDELLPRKGAYHRLWEAYHGGRTGNGNHTPGLE
ncbi:ABC transporter ATP-binding protein [Streptosporangium sp. KLBMP 9127]|nr:ABC transporter ATP-binding protein/permease [Streptosporangium sp. KLBMP 9127]